MDVNGCIQSMPFYISYTPVQWEWKKKSNDKGL